MFALCFHKWASLLLLFLPIRDRAASRSGSPGIRTDAACSPHDGDSADRIRLAGDAGEDRGVHRVVIPNRAEARSSCSAYKTSRCAEHDGKACSAATRRSEGKCAAIPEAHRCVGHSGINVKNVAAGDSIVEEYGCDGCRWGLTWKCLHRKLNLVWCGEGH